MSTSRVENGRSLKYAAGSLDDAGAASWRNVTGLQLRISKLHARGRKRFCGAPTNASPNYRCSTSKASSSESLIGFAGREGQRNIGLRRSGPARLAPTLSVAPPRIVAAIE